MDGLGQVQLGHSSCVTSGRSHQLEYLSFFFGEMGLLTCPPLQAAVGAHFYKDLE